MAILLSLETSTGVCSAALHDDGKILASAELHVAQSAASSLAVMISGLFKICAISPESIDGVAIAAGPGSYTGLRIGTATAKGICYSLNVPLFAVNTLELMTWQVRSSFVTGLSGTPLVMNEPFLLCPMLDARRMEVYCLLADQLGSVISPTSAKVIDEQSFEDELENARILFFGNGAEKCKGVIRHDNAVFLSGITPAASKLGELAFQKFTSDNQEDLSSFEPFYLKDFIVKKPKAQI